MIGIEDGYWSEVGGEALVRRGDQALEHAHERVPLGRLESVEELVGGRVEDPGRALLDGVALRSEGERVRAPVGRVPPADHDALLLELVDQLDDGRAVDPELLAQRLLGDRAFGQQVQDAAEPDAQSHGRESSSGELLAGPGGDDEERPGAVGEGGWYGHGWSIPRIDHQC